MQPKLLQHWQSFISRLYSAQWLYLRYVEIRTTECVVTDRLQYNLISLRTPFSLGLIATGAL